MKNTLLILTLFFGFIIPPSLQAATTDVVKDGKLDLRAWDPDVKGLIKVRGEWEFYWSQLLAPEDFKNQKEKDRSLIHVPGSWNSVANFSTKGIATYRLRVSLDQVRELAIRIPTIWSSSRVYIDDHKVLEAGRVGAEDDRKVYEPGIKDRYLVFTPSQKDFDIIVQVASFEFFLAGIASDVSLGKPSLVLEDREIEALIGFFLVGSLFIMGIYHLCLFALRTEARSTLYFGLVLIFSCGYMLAAHSSALILFLPHMGFTGSIRLFNSWIPAIGFFAYFTRELFPQYGSKRFIQGIAVVSYSLYALILTTEPRTFVPWTVLGQVMTLLLSIHTLYFVTKAIRAGENGARLLAGGSLALIFSSIHDVMLARGVFQSIPLGSAGLFVFIFFQSFLLARRFSNAFVVVEKSEKEIRKLSDDLRTEHHHVLSLNEHLEEKVEEKTRDIRSIMAHIPLGIFAITADHYKIHKDYSQHLHELFGVQDLTDLNACPLLFDSSNLSSDEKSQAISVLDACLGEDIMMFEMNAHSLPREIKRQQSDGIDRIFDLTWNPIVNEDNVIEKILVTLRDVTELRALEEDAQDKKEELQFIGELINVSGDAFRRFILSCRDFISENRKLLKASSIERTDIEVLKVLFINMHTMKGAARSLYFKKMTRIFHDVEQYYAVLQKETGEKWDLSRMSRDLDEVESIVNAYTDINKHKLKRKTDDEKDIEIPESQVVEIYQNLLVVSGRIKHVLDEKTHGILRDMRSWIFPKIFIPAQDTLVDISHCVGTLAKDLNKALPEVKIEAADFYLSHRGDDLLRKIFVHILRNSMDHGIETPVERADKGKPKQGRIAITMKKTSGGVEMKFQDDGRGLNLNKIKAIALLRGLVKNEQQVTNEEIAELIFCSGLSTAGQVSDVSGRGVGMDAVRTFLLNEDGNIKIHLLQPSSQGHDFHPFYFEIFLPDHLFAATKEEPMTVAA